MKRDGPFILQTILKDFTHKRLRMQIFPNKTISFWEYLGTFYVKSKIKEQKILPLSVKDYLLKKVAMQHEYTSLQSFYNAIFFATPLDKELREKISRLGQQLIDGKGTENVVCVLAENRTKGEKSEFNKSILFCM